MDIKTVQSVLILSAFTALLSARATYQKYIKNCLSAPNNNEINNSILFNNVMVNIENDTITVSYKKTCNNSDTSIEERKSKNSGNNLIQYALIPAFFMSGMMPWIMPKLQMAVMVVSMMNNMVFTSALFTMIRNFVFEKQPNEHVIYINNGYKKNTHNRRIGKS